MPFAFKNFVSFVVQLPCSKFMKGCWMLDWSTDDAVDADDTDLGCRIQDTGYGMQDTG